jgi:hypothetical protein
MRLFGASTRDALKRPNQLFRPCRFNIRTRFFKFRKQGLDLEAVEIK